MQTYTGYPRSGEFLRDKALVRFMAEFLTDPVNVWHNCRRGDFLLAVAEIHKCPKWRLQNAADALAAEAVVWLPRFKKIYAGIQPVEGATRGKNSRHWRGHVGHAISDLGHCIDHADHLTGHDGAQHAALAADHFIAALCLAYTDTISDPNEHRVKGIQEGYRITEEIVRKHIQFSNLSV